MIIETMRKRLGPWLVTGILGFIAFVFIFSGVFSPKSTSGLHQGAVAGEVNGEAISLREFQQEFRRTQEELNQRAEMFKKILGDKAPNLPTPDSKVISQQAFARLVQQKLVLQEAQRLGEVPGPEEIRERIRQMAAFQKDGKFDLASYRRTLEANGYTDYQFEELMKSDIAMQNWNGIFQRRVQVTEAEVRAEYGSRNEQRKFKYVVIPMAPPVKEGEKTQWNADQLADQALEGLKASDASDSALQSKLAVTRAKVSKSDWVAHSGEGVLPGVGKVPELFRDAFQKNSSLAQAPKKYLVASGVLVARVIEAKEPDWSKFEAQKEALRSSVALQKTRELEMMWMDRLQSQAKIVENPAVVSGEASGS